MRDRNVDPFCLALMLAKMSEVQCGDGQNAVHQEWSMQCFLQYWYLPDSSRFFVPGKKLVRMQNPLELKL